MPRLLTPSKVADFRNRLCEVAMQLLAEVGYEGFNMRELASRLGVSAMTAYRYFKDKDEILAAVRTKTFDRLADRLELAAAISGTPAARCAAVCQSYVEFGRQEPIYYRLMFETPRRPADPTPDFQRAELRVRAALTGYLATTENPLNGETELLGRVLWSALHGIVTLYLAEKLSPDEVENSLIESLRMIGTGYGDLSGAHLHLPRSGDPKDTQVRHQGDVKDDGAVTLSAAS